MPTSAIEQIPVIMRVVSSLSEQHQHPLRILDCGIGNGRYGFLIRDSLDVFHEPQNWNHTIDGIEMFSAYITPAHRYVYSSIRENNIADVLPSIANNTYDLALMIDVLEHFAKVEGTDVLRQFARVAKVCIIATPQYFFEQNDVYGNEAEIHRSVWTKKDFLLDSMRVTSLSTIAQQVFVLGGTTSFHKELRRWKLRQKVRDLLPVSVGAYVFEQRERKQGRRDSKK